METTYLYWIIGLAGIGIGIMVLLWWIYKQPPGAPFLYPFQAKLEASRWEVAKRIGKSTAEQSRRSAIRIAQSPEAKQLLNVTTAEGARIQRNVILEEYGRQLPEKQKQMKRAVYFASKSTSVASRSGRLSPERQANLREVSRIYADLHREMD
jgi:DNA topoisomerase VI subunit A